MPNKPTKKLVDVAMPIKEISTESVWDTLIMPGQIYTCIYVGPMTLANIAQYYS
ncbi:MAG: hypothetical protein H7325_06215 [Pedobacter sp.]|nr:hypothetical protein [Pedobacter sp.]